MSTGTALSIESASPWCLLLCHCHLLIVLQKSCAAFCCCHSHVGCFTKMLIVACYLLLLPKPLPLVNCLFLQVGCGCDCHHLPPLHQPQLHCHCDCIIYTCNACYLVLRLLLPLSQMPVLFNCSMLPVGW